MRLAAVLAVLAAVAAPVAEAKPRVKCLVRKNCGRHAHVRSVAPPMVAANPFVLPVAVTPPPAPARLGVAAREWSLVLSRTTLAAGPAVVELQNFGEDAHNLRLERVDGPGPPLSVPLAEAGERKSAAGTLAAGRYKVYCALPGHDAAGMHATLEVR
jgi:Copper binding proteins, plastocyanin/azurin family